MKHDPILITGVERSGSTLIARILDMCEVQSGRCNGMFEHVLISECNREYLKQYLFGLPTIDMVRIPPRWKDVVESSIHVDQNKRWMLKSGTLARMWQVYNNCYPDAKWLIVRRRTGDVIQSCLKTGYMRVMKDPGNLRFLNCKTEEEGWLWWIHQYEDKFVEMIKAGLNCRIVWPDRMASGDYKQIQETVEWLGLKWNEKIPEVINPLIVKK